ncbi:MAG: transposase family protein [Deltaproteobacteria bacterium]|nr:transposase family protein [Deltaproteobacteria bacterium]
MSSALFPPLFKTVADPRAPANITYPFAALAFATVLRFLCRLGARRQVGLLRCNGPSAAKFQALFGVETCPHGDTLNALFSRLEPDQVQTVVTGMTQTLVRKQVLYPSRLCNRFLVVAVAGTGLLTFHERHCPTCLTRTHHGKTLYYHHVLEATLVTPNGFSCSLMREFIENPGAQPTTQDGELKAFYRLAERPCAVGSVGPS